MSDRPEDRGPGWTGPTPGPLADLRYRARSLLSLYPGAYLPIARRRFADVPDRVVDQTTDLVIDGFERCGTTFAWVAFESAQARPVRVVHHLHAAAQVVEAVRLGIPTIVVIREPEDAVLSHVIRHGDVRIASALHRYVSMYRRILPLRDSVVVSDFPRTTGDLGSVIREVNRRFGTHFEEFEHTPENVRRCFEHIERLQMDHLVQVEPEKVGRFELAVPRPSAERGALKEALRRRYGAEELASRRMEALRVYRSLLAPGRKA